MSDTILVAIITACATTLPQIIIAIINHLSLIKNKKIELFNETRQKVIFDFLESVGQCTGDGITLSEKVKYQQSLNKLLLYFPDLDTTLLESIYKSLFVSNTNDKMESLQPLIIELSKSIKDI